jgi:hypothetical protein
MQRTQIPGPGLPKVLCELKEPDEPLGFTGQNGFIINLPVKAPKRVAWIVRGYTSSPAACVGVRIGLGGPVVVEVAVSLGSVMSLNVRAVALEIWADIH